jgi:hypothetical protein
MVSERRRQVRLVTCVQNNCGASSEQPFSTVQPLITSAVDTIMTDFSFKPHSYYLWLDTIGNEADRFRGEENSDCGDIYN